MTKEKYDLEWELYQKLEKLPCNVRYCTILKLKIYLTELRKDKLLEIFKQK